jgi:hypothetical protein
MIIRHDVVHLSAALTSPQLDARRATIILAVTLVAMLAGGLVTGVIGAVVFWVQGNDFQEPRQADHFLRIMSDPISVVATVAGGMAILWKSRSLPRAVLLDGSPVGAAWTVGTAKQLSLGLGVGTHLGVARAVTSTHQAGHVAFGAVHSRPWRRLTSTRSQPHDELSLEYRLPAARGSCCAALARWVCPSCSHGCV